MWRGDYLCCSSSKDWRKFTSWQARLNPHLDASTPVFCAEAPQTESELWDVIRSLLSLLYMQILQ